MAQNSPIPSPVLGVALLLFISGCNCGGVEVITTADAFCREMARLQCEQGVRCDRVSKRHQDLCEESASAQCAVLSERVGRGHTTFNREAAQACVDASSDETRRCDRDRGIAWFQPPAWAVVEPVDGYSGNRICNRGSVSTGWVGFRSPVPQCDEVFAAATAAGQACLTADDCRDVGHTCAGDGCDRRCQAAGKAGLPCMPSGSCGLEATCDFESWTCTTSNACTSDSCPQTEYCTPDTKMCEPKLGLGEICSTYVRPCAEGLYCAESQRCEPIGNVGDACTSWDGCVLGLRCVDGTCQERLGEGQPCADSKLGADSCLHCQPHLACDRVLGTCERPRVVATGEVCTTHSLQCAWNERCAGAELPLDGGTGRPGRCEPPRAVGEACASNEECAAGTHCGEGARCTASGEGSPCLVDYECPNTHRCANGACRALPGLGESCLESLGRCADSFVCASGQNPPVCARFYADEGEACAHAPGSCKFPFECVGGQCIEVGTIGKPCRHHQCDVGACEVTGTDGVGATCVPPRPYGAPCSSGTECESGICDARRCASLCGSGT